MLLKFTKQPVAVFYKDDVGGKTNNIHVVFSSDTAILNEVVNVVLMLYNTTTDKWSPFEDQTVLEICSNINTATYNNIDIFYRVELVSYRNNNQPYCLRINIGQFAFVQSDPFYVKSKSIRKQPTINTGSSMVHSLEKAKKAILNILTAIHETNQQLETIIKQLTDQKFEEQNESMTRVMSFDTFDFAV